MKLSEIRAILAELETEPRKSLGQNFLYDQNLAQWIVGQLDLKPEDHLLEVGPGLGALTVYALPRCKSAQLIERDGRMASYLRSRFTAPELEVIHGDALEFDARTLFEKQPIKILGNLPYYVSSPILFKFTAEPSAAERLVFTLQKEVAQRLSAEPSTREYGALTLLIQRRWRVRYLKTLPPQVFFPEPGIESAVVLLTPRAPDELAPCDSEQFKTLVKRGFSQRRKQLRNLLKLPEWGAIAKELGVPETVRAEELDVEQWIRLVKLAMPEPQALAQDVHGEWFDVVDAADSVAGRATRHEVHTRGLKHRAVHIFVFNSRGELFLQKRSPWKDANPSRWDSSAAGHVNSGQTYGETAPRELHEELGVAAPLEFLVHLPASEKTGWEFVQLYRACHDGPFRLPPSEIEYGGFFPIQMIEHWIEARPGDFSRGFMECFSAYRSLQEAAPPP